MKKWSQFNENTKNSPPRNLYYEAVELINNESPIALDIAAGALNETKDMLSRGFEVTAIDSNEDIIVLGNSIDDNKLTIVTVDMSNFDYGTEKYDFIVAMFALPFISPSLFGNVFKKITSSLKEQGIFAFHLFGTNDKWSLNPNMTFHSKDSAVKLIDGLNVLKFKEIEYDGKIANGEKKHWHIFQIIISKNSV